MKPLKFGIVGAGLIGKKRALAIQSLGSSVVSVFDVDRERRKELAQLVNAESAPSLSSLLQHSEIDAVIIATTNDALASAAQSSAECGKHVLVEKPAGRNPQEIRDWIQFTESRGVVARVGFNHRFHPAMRKAKELLGQEAIGPLMYFRSRYGHGGRRGYDKEWRAIPEKGGGGELLDQGVHIIDLCRWFGGEFNLEYGRVDTFYWNMPVEDNGFLLLTSPDQRRKAWLHASCTEWKNTFEFEIFGKQGKLQIVGLGGSYGKEELRYYRVKPEMGVPDEQIFTFNETDESWKLEITDFIRAVAGERTEIASARDALRATEIVYEAYRQSKVSW